MRSALVIIVMLFSTLFCYPIHLRNKHLFKKDRVRSWEKAHKLVRWFFGLELRCAGCKVEVVGREKLPEGAALFVGNHRSYYDIPIYHQTVNRPCGFVAKKEMEKFPLLPIYMRDIGCLFLDRKDIKQGLETIKLGTEYLKDGHSMVLFPEGTRNHAEELLPFRDGGFKMAEKSKRPIVPMAIIGSDKLLEMSGKKGLRKGTVRICIGDPVYPSELPPKERKEYYAKLPHIITQMIKENS